MVQGEHDEVDERALSLTPLYLGGFLGPFGTIIITPMFPELREAFGLASSTPLAWSFFAYLLPFAILLLVSGTLGERWGRRRTVRTTYLLYAATSVLAAVAPNFAVFVAARALQGVANAFITPLLLAGLAERVRADRMGRAVGIYSSFQAIGGGLAPVLGGLAADTNWRLAFWGTAVASIALAAYPPPGEPRAVTDIVRIKPLLTRRLIVLGVGFFAAAMGPIGLGVLVGPYVRDVLGLSGLAAGIILFGGALAAFVMGPVWGSVIDRLGASTSLRLSTVAVSVMAAMVALGSTSLRLAVVWVAMGAVVGWVTASFQAIAAQAMPENRGGALSFLMSFRFLGHAVGPLALLPVLDRSPATAFVVGGAIGVVAIAAAMIEA